MRLNEHLNTHQDYERARSLRTNAAPMEKKLWVALREEAKINGLKFCRQTTIHPYIADFACMEVRLLIELDGTSHDSQMAYDQKRQQDLEKRSFVVIRFTNDEVSKNLSGIVAGIIEKALSIKRNNATGSQLNSPLPCPPHEGEGT